MDTRAEETREVVESVIDALRLREPSPDRARACQYLLRHLLGNSPRLPLGSPAAENHRPERSSHPHAFH